MINIKELLFDQHKTTYFDPQKRIAARRFLVCTQLSGRMMRIRNAYPRGDRWLVGEMEDWEREYKEAGWLYSDPLHPELYVD